MKKVVVFGANGFLGKRICHEFLENNFSVIGIGRSKYCDSISSNYMTYIQEDVIKLTNFEEIINNAVAVIYLISTKLPLESNCDPVIDIQENLIPIVKILETLKEKKNCKIIFASSGGTIYGDYNLMPLVENMPTSPLCSYGINKLAVEKYMEMYGKLYCVDWISLRIGNPYGEGQYGDKAQGVIGAFLKKIYLNEEICIWGDGKVIRDYIAVEDVAKAFMAAFEYTGNERIFNIGTERGISLNQILEILFELTAKKVPVTYMDKRSVDVQTNILSIQKAKDELNWMPCILFEDGVKKMISNFKIKKGAA